ncbi:MAG: DUF3253 domain-containing protein [Acidimicrobiia bacterium]|nr:DUF3253 domain-containing protein [Acidimicrobiia bacterium]
MDRSADGHWVIVDGRRWRATDPAIPAKLRSELVAELMDARRAVGAAKRSSDADAEADARQRVAHAKVALGERGEPWWEVDRRTPDPARIRATLFSLLRHRSAGSVCPSDIARTIGADEWREVMDQVRDVVRTAAADGEVVATQGKDTLDPAATWKGPIRIRATQDLIDG